MLPVVVPQLASTTVTLLTTGLSHMVILQSSMLTLSLAKSKLPQVAPPPWINIILTSNMVVSSTVISLKLKFSGL